MDLKQLFLQTSSANDNIRKKAEDELKALEKNIDFLRYVKDVLMRDQDKILQHITSLYFMVTMERLWKVPEVAPIVNELEDSITELLMIEDKNPRSAYLKILQCIFEHSFSTKIENIFLKSESYINSSNPQEYNVALTLYEEFFKSENLKYSGESYKDIIFNKFGIALTNRFTESIASRKYNSAAMCMKIISKAYASYGLPDFLSRVDVFSQFFQISIEILKIKEKPTENFLKLHKWAVYFLYKSTSRGFKKYFKDAKLSAFIKSEPTINAIYSAFSYLLSEYLNGASLDPKVPVYIANLFTLFASNKLTKHFIKGNYSALITSFILPANGFCDDIKDAFEFDNEKYLQERYNYRSSDLKDETEELFTEILESDKDIENQVILSLKGALDANTDFSNASVRYAIIGLLAGSQKSLTRTLGVEGFNMFVKNYIFNDLNSSFPFIVSQALFFLSNTDSFDIADAQVVEALSKIVTMTNGEHQALAVESCLALNCFFYNESLSAMFKPIIASLFEKVLGFSKVYFIEALSSLCDSIIDCYTDDISKYAPLFVQSLCASFMERIEQDKDSDVPAISGCLSTIEKLIMTADDKPDIVKSIYASTSKIIFYVFKNEKFEFFQECFDLMNSFLFVLRVIDQSMFEIFVIALSTDREEISLYPREVGDFIDNFLTFGKDTMINVKTLDTIFNIIDVFIPLNCADSDVYDEDFEAGCRIIESLMLNAGKAAHQTNSNLIPAILHKIISNYNYATTYDSLPLYALECIMNCYIVSPDVTLHNLGSFTIIFFDELEKNKDLFKRVYDKKLFILFTGALFETTAPISMRFDQYSNILSGIITSLPDAIIKRNKLQEKADNDEYSNEDEGSDYSAELIFEDIYFVTILDTFDAYEYSRNILSNIQPNTIGQQIISEMSQENISNIKRVLDSPQVAQK